MFSFLSVISTQNHIDLDLSKSSNKKSKILEKFHQIAENKLQESRRQNLSDPKVGRQWWSGVTCGRGGNFESLFSTINL
jgi:hypothetical protein